MTMDVMVGLAGLAGGALLGLKGYGEAKIEEKQGFDPVFFVKSMIVPALGTLGAVAMIPGLTPEQAFSIGLTGKIVQESFPLVSAAVMKG